MIVRVLLMAPTDAFGGVFQSLSRKHTNVAQLGVLNSFERSRQTKLVTQCARCARKSTCAGEVCGRRVSCDQYVCICVFGWCWSDGRHVGGSGVGLVGLEVGGC